MAAAVPKKHRQRPRPLSHTKKKQAMGDVEDHIIRDDVSACSKNSFTTATFTDVVNILGLLF
jgi:hypothetical protein